MSPNSSVQKQLNHLAKDRVCHAIKVHIEKLHSTASEFTFYFTNPKGFQQIKSQGQSRECICISFQSRQADLSDQKLKIKSRYLWHNLVDINSWRQACQPLLRLLRLIEWGMSSLLFTASPSKNAFVMSNPIPFSQCFATLLFVKNVDLGVPHPRNSLDQSIHMEVHSAPAAHTAR